MVDSIAGLLRVRNAVDVWLPNHNIKHDWLVTPIHDNLSKALKAESLVYSDILASTGLKIAGFIQLISLTADE